MYKFDISVVITSPGIPKSQKKYGLSACILSENEKQAIRIMGVHRAIARGGILMELSSQENYIKMENLNKDVRMEQIMNIFRRHLAI